MQSIPTRLLVSAVVALMLATSATAQPKRSDEAPEFPIGLFSDGRDYRLSDFRGRVVVLFFYESDCPRCKGSIPERNEIVKAFEGKPVKFFAIGAGDSPVATQSYGRETQLRMTIFADNLSLMEARYGQKISLDNIWQFRVIGPDGQIVGTDMKKETIERALEKAAFKYDPKDYDAKLKPALEAFEWNQWDLGMKLLSPLRRSGTKAVAESAKKLYDVLKKEAEGWKAEADSLATSDLVKAYDLYARVAAHFSTEALGKRAASAKEKLASSKAVMAELAARKAYAQFAKDIAGATLDQKVLVLKQAQVFVKKHAGTPTADKIAALASELEKK